jgi:calcineurin-like phosphoesterase family protein
VLSHYPIASWEDMSKGWMHLFGHVHLRPNHALREGKAMDVGMDGNNFKPHSFQDILSIMRKQPIASLSLPRDHHSEDVK